MSFKINNNEIDVRESNKLPTKKHNGVANYLSDARENYHLIYKINLLHTKNQLRYSVQLGTT